MIIEISSTSSNPLLAALTSLDSFAVSSSSAADNSQTCTIAGATTYGGSVGQNLTATLTGQKEVVIGTFGSITLAGLSSAPAGNVTVTKLSGGAAAHGSIYYSALPANGDTVSFQLGSLTASTYTFKTTPTSANEVLIGADAAATVLNLQYAITADAGHTSAYGSGTVANPDFTATANGSALTFIDKLTCARRLAWTIAGSTAGVSIVQPSGGISSTLMCTLTPTQTVASIADIRLTNEAVSISSSSDPANAKQVPPYFTFVSDWIQLYGNTGTLYITAAPYAPGTLSFSYQTSTDPTKTVSRAGLTAITGIAGASQVIPLTEKNIEYIRFFLTTSGSTAAASVNAKLIVQGRFAIAP